MTLPDPVLVYLGEKSRAAGAEAPQPHDDLFKTGALDSFALIDFLTVLEENCNVKVPDAEVNAANFQSIDAIERFVERLREKG